MNSMWRAAFVGYRSTMSALGKQYVSRVPCHPKALTGYPRTMWHMCSSKSTDNEFLRPKGMTELCQCGCNGLLHTESEKSLADFLKREIQEEKKAQKMSSLPNEIHGFTVKADGAELSFEKKNQLETITVTLNVNHSVSTEDGVGEEYSDEMKSKPAFEVDITRKNRTLNFCCSYVDYMEPDGKSDVYQIDEVAFQVGEWDDKHYSVAGDILDESLYDLFMTLLSEKGITNEFMEQVSEVATFYEHSKYVNLLEDIFKFASAN